MLMTHVMWLDVDNPAQRSEVVEANDVSLLDDLKVKLSEVPVDNITDYDVIVDPDDFLLEAVSPDQ